MAARVPAAFGNRSARRRAPSPLFLVPPRLTDDASHRHPPHSPLSQRDHRHLEALESVEQASGISPTRAKPAAPMRYAFTFGRRSRILSATDRPTYQPTSLCPNTWRDILCSHPPLPASQPFLSPSCTHIQTFIHTTGPVDSRSLRYLL